MAAPSGVFLRFLPLFQKILAAKSKTMLFFLLNAFIPSVKMDFATKTKSNPAGKPIHRAQRKRAFLAKRAQTLLHREVYQQDQE